MLAPPPLASTQSPPRTLFPAVLAAHASQATVNMSAQELEGWLAGPDSRAAVAQAGEDADRDGRRAARRIVELLRKDDELMYEADFQQMHQ